MKTIKVRPILLPTNYIGATLTLYHDGKGKYPKLSTDLNKLQFHTNQELILISLEDEKIEVGNVFLNTTTNTIHICNEVNNNICSGLNHGEYHGKFECKKIVATQSQLPPELIQQLADEYNNGGMRDFGIEMVCFDELQSHSVEFAEMWENNIDYKPKLTNGFITVVEKEYSYNLLCNMQYYMEYCQENGYVTPQEWLKKFKHYSDRKESILYTEEEIFDLGDRYEEYCINCFGNLPKSFSKWFNQNKKK